MEQILGLNFPRGRWTHGARGCGTWARTCNSLTCTFNRNQKARPNVDACRPVCPVGTGLGPAVLGPRCPPWRGERSAQPRQSREGHGRTPLGRQAACMAEKAAGSARDRASVPSAGQVPWWPATLGPRLCPACTRWPWSGTVLSRPTLAGCMAARAEGASVPERPFRGPIGSLHPPPSALCPPLSALGPRPGVSRPPCPHAAPQPGFGPSPGPKAAARSGACGTASLPRPRFLSRDTGAGGPQALVTCPPPAPGVAAAPARGARHWASGWPPRARGPVRAGSVCSPFMLEGRVAAALEREPGPGAAGASPGRAGQREAGGRRGWGTSRRAPARSRVLPRPLSAAPPQRTPRGRGGAGCGPRPCPKAFIFPPCPRPGRLGRGA